MIRIKTPGNVILKDVKTPEEALEHIKTIIDAQMVDEKETIKLLSSGWVLGFNGYHYQKLKDSELELVFEEDEKPKKKSSKSTKSLSEDMAEVQKSIKASHKKTESEIEKEKKAKKKTTKKKS